MILCDLLTTLGTLGTLGTLITQHFIRYPSTTASFRNSEDISSRLHYITYSVPLCFLRPALGIHPTGNTHMLETMNESGTVQSHSLGAEMPGHTIGAISLGSGNRVKLKRVKVSTRDRSSQSPNAPSKCFSHLMSRHNLNVTTKSKEEQKDRKVHNKKCLYFVKRQRLPAVLGNTVPLLYIYMKDPLLVTSLYGPSDAAQAICCTKKTMLGQLFMVPSIVRLRTAKSRYSSIDPTGD